MSSPNEDKMIQVANLLLDCEVVLVEDFDQMSNETDRTTFLQTKINMGTMWTAICKKGICENSNHKLHDTAWRFWNDLHEKQWQMLPNAGYSRIEYMAEKKLLFVITTNIDRIWHKAGFKKDVVYERAGQIRWKVCSQKIKAQCSSSLVNWDKKQCKVCRSVLIPDIPGLRLNSNLEALLPINSASSLMHLNRFTQCHGDRQAVVFLIGEIDSSRKSAFAMFKNTSFVSINTKATENESSNQIHFQGKTVDVLCELYQTYLLQKMKRLFPGYKVPLKSSLEKLLVNKQDTWFSNNNSEPKPTAAGWHSSNNIQYRITDETHDEEDVTSEIWTRDMTWVGTTLSGACGCRGCGVRFHEKFFINVWFFANKKYIYEEEQEAYDEQLKSMKQETVTTDKAVMCEHDGYVRLHDPYEIAEYVIDVNKHDTVLYEWSANEELTEWVEAFHPIRWWTNQKVPWNLLNQDGQNTSLIETLIKKIGKRPFLWRFDIDEENDNFNRINLAFVFDLESIVEELMLVYKFGIENQADMRWI